MAAKADAGGPAGATMSHKMTVNVRHARACLRGA
jgi:hypothetical protein